MDKTKIIGSVVGGMIGCCICQYFRMKREEKQLKELHDTINRSTKSLMEQVNRDIKSFDIFLTETDKNIEETKKIQKRIDSIFDEQFGLD